jgi:SAM-dependent methyltransferase
VTLSETPQILLEDPVAAYDRIAPEFPRMSERRRAYLDRVEQLIVNAIPAGADSLLDVGGGDGARGRRIAQSRGIGNCVLLEPSAAMRGSDAVSSEIWPIRAEDLRGRDGQFDAIVCLWNVLGHIFPAAARVETLRQCARLLTPRGRFFADLNHRYNAREYGVRPTLARFLRDTFRPGDSNGDVMTQWSVRGEVCATRGHVFTHAEFRRLAGAAELLIEKRFVVDYATGEVRRWSLSGNLVYQLRRRE